MTEIEQDIRVVELSWPNVKDVKPRLNDYLGDDKDLALDPLKKYRGLN